MMTATLFTLTEACRVAGLGLVCPEARYASVRWAHADRLDRCHVSADQWREILQAIRAGLSPQPLAPSSALAAALTGGRLGLTVQWIHAQPVGAGHGPGAVANLLDRLLTSQALAGPVTPLREDDGKEWS